MNGRDENWLCPNILRWFSRNWVSKHDSHGGVTVLEIDRRKRIEAGEKWKKDNEEWIGWEEEVYLQAFDDNWQRETSEWWSDWKSLPLSDGSVGQHDAGFEHSGV